MFRRLVTPLIVAATLVLVSAAPASAAPPPPNPTPLQCVDEFTHNDNYVGDGWVGARVEGPPSKGPFGFLDRTDREFSLYCGNELAGVVHIAHPESTGTVHPIIAASEESFRACWAVTIAGGAREPQGDGRSRFVREYRKGEFSTAIVDDRHRFTYTLFTTSPNGSNDWLRCRVIES